MDDQDHEVLYSSSNLLRALRRNTSSLCKPTPASPPLPFPWRRLQYIGVTAHDSAQGGWSTDQMVLRECVPTQVTSANDSSHARFTHRSPAIPATLIDAGFDLLKSTPSFRFSQTGHSVRLNQAEGFALLKSNPHLEDSE